MTRSDLQQTFAGWEWLAIERGYTLAEVQLFASVYVNVIEATNGLYRPCGRPFINHLVGTASVLTYYGCPIRIVLAGLVHALVGLAGTRSSPTLDRVVAAIARLDPSASSALQIAQLHSDRQRLIGQDQPVGIAGPATPGLVAAASLLQLANDVEMHLSFEAAASGRSDLIPDQLADQCEGLLEFVGLPGLAETSRRLRREAPAVATISFGGAGQGSFRFDGPRIVSAYV